MASDEEFTPRPYQIDLYEKAIAENSIIYLPTGAGKTYVTVMVIKHLSRDIRIPWDEGGKRTCFLVNTVPLVTQQCAYVVRHTDLSCQGYSGDMNVDMWDCDKWIAEFKKFQVLVMTAQILLDLINHGFLPLSRINLVIFDECHHGVGDHPMRLIMKRFEDVDSSNHPRVLGTSATLLNSNVKTENVLNTVRELEITFHAKVITVDSMTPVKGYGKPLERRVEFDPPVQSATARICENIIDKVIEVLDVVQLQSMNAYNDSSAVFQPRSKSTKIKCVFEDIREHLKSQGIYVATKAILFHMVQIEKIKKSLDESQSIKIMLYLLTQMVRMQKILEDQMKGLTEYQKMFKFSNDQVLQLFSVLKKFHDQETNTDNKFCCIVFVQRRFTAKVLYHVLKRLAAIDERFKFLIPEYVIGNSADPLKNPQEAVCLQKWSAEALVKFRTGAVNCLIATDVLDEGVDIPACSLVVHYDLPKDFRSYVQSKGRGRHHNSQYVIFCSKDDQTFSAKYNAFCTVEKALSLQLIGKTDDRFTPLPEELENVLYTREVEPYVVVDSVGIKSAVTETSAISLINRYCTTLVQSKFVRCSAIYKLHHEKNSEQGDNYIVSLRMPIVSPLRDIIYGNFMPSISVAKRSAAMQACKKLHAIGELTDRLLPKSCHDMIEDITTFLDNWEEESIGKKMTGTTNNKRSHPVFCPEAFRSAFPQPDEMSYLHVIEMTPTYPAPYENRNLTFYQMLNNKAGFAILSSRKMPYIPDFPVYMNVGTLNIKLNVNHAQINLSSLEIKELRRFHWVIFGEEVLNLIKIFMVHDTDNMENSFLIVPINEEYKIAWDVVRKYETVQKVMAPKCSSLAITDNTEVECVPQIPLSNIELVTPNYRTATNIYVVTRVCDELSPSSAFPTEDYATYIHYFRERHTLEISDMKQPLLEVKPISLKINCTKPRTPSRSGTKRKRDDLEEHLIPELCYMVIFPALYWLKATALPSILHRINQLLIAEHLRYTIASQAGLGTISPLKKWPPLELRLLDIEENPEALMPFDSTLDDSQVDNIKSNLAPTSPDIDILSLDSRHYPWTKDQEPCDLERNIESVQLIDIDYYCQFVHGISNPNDTKDAKHRVYQEYSKKPTVPVPVLKALKQTIDSQGPSPVDVMSALTAKFANDAFNLERLETLGDSFLKFIASLYLFEAYPSNSEGNLTIKKGTIIGNRHLYYCGAKKDIPSFLKVDNFEPLSNFIVPSYCAPRRVQEKVKAEKKAPNVLYEVTVPSSERYEGELSLMTLQNFDEKIDGWVESTIATGVEHFVGVQIVPDKTVSDAVEALTGVYLNAMGPIGATKLLQWFGVLPTRLQVLKVFHGEIISAKLGDGDMDLHMPWADSIENTLGYKFKDRSFLLQAFTHSSYGPNTVTTSYDRLEFLGDAVIDFLITMYIYENCGDLSPGALTDLRSALVNNITFACLTVKYGLHTALLAYAPTLSDTIERFVKYQKDRDHVVNDELLWILLEEDECNMAEYVDVPKTLGDLFESVIGAIYLDTGKDLNIVWKILYCLMHKEILSFSKNVPKQPVRVIHETPGAHPKFLTAESIDGTQNIMVPLEVQIFGKKKLFHGFGATKKQAKAAAAKQALKSLRRNV